MSGREWTFGLCGCFDNCGICIITYFAPCYTFGTTSGNLGKNCCLYTIIYLVPILNFVCHCMQRAEIRNLRNIEGGAVSDLLSVWCCPFCSLIQEKAETEVMIREGQGHVVTTVTTQQVIRQ